jgi:hypothetical protein
VPNERLMLWNQYKQIVDQQKTPASQQIKASC